MLSFTQLNLHKATQATLLLSRELEGKHQVIACLSEPHTTAGRVTGFQSGLDVIYHRGTKGQPAPRAAILASRDLKLTAMDNWCNRDCAVAIANIHGRRTLIASIYLDINLPVGPSWLENLLNMTKTRGLPVLLSVDSNAHSCLYGPDNNQRGDDLEDLILNHELEVQNVGNDPTFEIRRGDKLIQTHIDITLTRDVHFDVSNWRVDRNYNASDHNTIRFETAAIITEKVKLRPWSKADWTAFQSYLTNADYKLPKDILSLIHI